MRPRARGIHGDLFLLFIKFLFDSSSHQTLCNDGPLHSFVPISPTLNSGCWGCAGDAAGCPACPQGLFRLQRPWPIRRGPLEGPADAPG